MTAAEKTLPRSTLLLMAFATGITVANLYYNQPLLDQIRSSFGVSVGAIGWIPTLTQIGYALGMLVLVPLGDMFSRKKLVLLMTLSSAAVTALFAVSPQFEIAVVASLLIGFTSITPQLLIPFAALLAKPAEKGKVVGTMMSGLLLGILLARTVSGFVGAEFGWRVMFALASASMILMAILLTIKLPVSEPSYVGKYSGLLASVFEIFKREPVLREAAFFGALLFGAFSAFWATLIHLLETPTFNLGARAVGLFGLLGAAAALLTPVIGTVVDRREPRNVTGFMILLTIFSFGVYWISESSLIGLGIGVILMDIGVQCGHVSNQTRIFALMPSAQSRIQTAYMFCYFVGGAAGSLLGTLAWQRFSWSGVCGVAVAMLTVALIKFAAVRPR